MKQLIYIQAIITFGLSIQSTSFSILSLHPCDNRPPGVIMDEFTAFTNK